MSEQDPTSEQSLFLVATPIGNLGDITLRALEILRTVDVVASEDTRKTGLLLKHFDIKKPQIPFHEHNEQQAGERLIHLLEQGKSVALVTDAGTPGISDPGFTLVRRALAAGIGVTMAPGPSALIMALVLSGLPVHSFTFRGFPPRKAGPRQRFFAVDRDAPHTLIYYESPYRIAASLRDALSVLGDRRGALANDLTKRFELVQRGSLATLLAEVEGKDLRVNSASSSRVPPARQVLLVRWEPLVRRMTPGMRMPELELAHGTVRLPIFLPDATLGVVRAVDAADLEACAIEAVVMNTFHLMRRPGSSTVQALGGLHQMSGWPHPIVTDSGGFQAYSLIREQPKRGSLSDQGITYTPEGGDRTYHLTPEKTVQLQLKYGADIVICLDDCTHVDDDEATQVISVRRTIAWAKRCKAEFAHILAQRKRDECPPRLFAIVQGEALVRCAANAPRSCSP